MAFVYPDRVKEQSSTTGTGDLTLAGAVPGFRTFDTGVAVGNQTYYTIVLDSNNTWEVGIGTLTGSNILQRTTVLASSNANLLVNFASGTKIVSAVVASQFFAQTLLTSAHATLNHSGIPGVPAPESFTSASHDLVDHTAAPFNLLDVTAHESVNHLAPPFNLLDEPTHDLLDHTGLPGVSSFDSSAHATTNHTGLPGVPPPESFTNAVHAVTDHASIPGVFSLATHAATNHAGIPGVPGALQFATHTFGPTSSNISFSVGFTPFMLVVLYELSDTGGGVGVAFGTNSGDQSTGTLNFGATSSWEHIPERVISSSSQNPDNVIYTLSTFGGGTVTLTSSGDTSADTVSGRVFVFGN